jgi:tetratricopeptide (TPR) repeat protein
LPALTRATAVPQAPSQPVVPGATASGAPPAAAVPPAPVLSMRARGRPDDGHLVHRPSGAGDVPRPATPVAAGEAAAGFAETIAAAAAAATAAQPDAPPPPPPPPTVGEVLAAFLSAAANVSVTNARFAAASGACGALATAMANVGELADGFAEVVAARDAVAAALATRRTEGAPFTGADGELCPPLLLLLAAATARCEAALDRTPVRVIRAAQPRAAWRASQAAAAATPWPLFLAGLVAYAAQQTDEPRAQFIIDRLTSPSGDARLRWHIDRGNSGTVGVADIDAAFPPDVPLFERLVSLLDCPPEKHVDCAQLHATLPARTPGLAPREAPLGALGARLLTEKRLRAIALVGGPGMGKSTLAIEVAHDLLADGQLPGGAFFADLRGRGTRAGAGAALALAVGAPPLGGPDPEGAALAALRRCAPRATLLILDGCDAALSGGEAGDFYALLARLLTVGPHLRLLLTACAAVESGLEGVASQRVGPLPLKACCDALVAAYPPGGEMLDPALSRHFAKEAAQLCGRAPLAVALNVATLEATTPGARGAAVGALLHTLRLARGVRFEGPDTGSACVNCALTNPWDHVLEFLAPSRYYNTAADATLAQQEEAAAAAAAAQRAATAAAPSADYEGSAMASPLTTIAGLKVAEYEAVLKACAGAAWAALPRAAAAAAPALAVFPASFDARAAHAVLAAAPGVPPAEAPAALALLVQRRLLAHDARSGRYAMARLVRAALAEVPGGAAALAAAAPAFVAHLGEALADAERDAAAGAPEAGLYETDREWHNLEEATSAWGVAGAADGAVLAAIEALREARTRVLAARAPPSDRPLDALDGDAAVNITNLKAYAEELAGKGQYEESLKAYEEALALQQSSVGGYDASLADTHAAMAFIRAAACDDESAIVELERALAIQTLALGADHPDLAITLIELSNARRKLGELDAAATLARRALALLADAKGPEHADVAVAHNALGNVYKAQGQLPAALEAYRLALRVREAALGPRHVDVANTLWNIACVYELQDRFADANAVLVRAVRIYAAELGPQHDETVEAMQFAARMGEAKRIVRGGDLPWKAPHDGHAWSRNDGTV